MIHEMAMTIYLFSLVIIFAAWKQKYCFLSNIVIQFNMTDIKKEEAEKPSKKPPPYGSQEYWEKRYRENYEVVIEGKATDADADAESSADGGDQPSPFHSWYFTYDELKPLLLPLILGGREDVQQIIGDVSHLDENKLNKEEGEEEDSSEQSQVNKKDSKASNGTEMAQESSSNKIEYNNQQKECNTESHQDAKNDDIDEEKGQVEEEDEWEEIEENEDESSENEEEPLSTVGLAVSGPISVLEIGCGDAPLGTELADDMMDLEMKTGAKASLVVNRIVCTDYSSTLIDMMKRLYTKKRKKNEPVEKSGVGNEEHKLENHSEEKIKGNLKSELNVEFVVADARDLPYPDGFFHLILEKGTMDAMLSDSEVGIPNCIKIVSDSARVLAVGGKQDTFLLLSYSMNV